MSTPKIPVSVLVLTKNEEQDLPECLASVAWSDDVHVYDSYSNDSTSAIAKASGATVTQRAFDNWASHQNWGLSNLKFRHQWVFYIDADERVTDQLRSSIEAAIQNPRDIVAFYVRRRDFWNATWLRHAQATSHYIRLFDPTRITYERLVNPVTIVKGKTEVIKGFLDHYPFSKGLTHWIGRHNSYSSLEAGEAFAKRSQRIDWRSVLWATDLSTRRAAQKALFYKLPGRPFLKFLVFYFLRRGFLDGRAGLHYAILQSIYEYFIVRKTEEMKAESGSCEANLR